MTDDAALKMAGVTVGYGPRDVLRAVSLTIRPGETHCLLGVNGSGKTTLIRTILGRVRPRSGTVVVAVPGVGLVPQEIALFPRLTVAENLAVFARLAGLSRLETPRRVQDIAVVTGIAGYMGAIVATLSGGWQRRVNIASAILHRPALLILDEPTVGMDVAARAEVQGVIRRLAAEGMGILMTTHDLPEAEALCSHAVLLSAGTITAQGPVTDLLTRHFSDRLMLSLLLDGDPDPEQARVLRSLGFAASAAGATRLVADDQAGLKVVTDLRAAGVALRGYDLKRPGLATLYDTLQGDAR